MTRNRVKRGRETPRYNPAATILGGLCATLRGRQPGLRETHVHPRLTRTRDAREGDESWSR